VFAPLLARWNALPPRVRGASTCAAAAIAFIAIVAGIVAARPRAALFATPLHSEQLAEVQDRLASWNVAFVPSADNVTVDAAQRSDLLLRLSLAGVPHAHVASSGETLAQIGALTPQAVVDAQTRAGLAGDLELALRGVAGVDDAQVIVAPARAATFADESGAGASASVRLHVRDRAQLSGEAIEGIRQFVAAGVPDLDPSRVTILDDAGVALDGAAGGDDASDLQASLQSALDAAVGPGATIVRVRGERDPRALVSRTTRDAPLGALSLSGTDETFGGGGRHYEKRERSEQRGDERRDVTATQAPGRLARLSVAVFVDASRDLDLAAIRALASATVGLDPRRGDTIGVEPVTFARDRIARTDGWWLAYGAIVPALPAIAVAVVALFALRLLLPAMRAAATALIERASIVRTREAVRGFAPSHVASVLREEPPHAAAAIISALPAATAAAVLDLYPAAERSAIVRRMSRPRSSLIPDAGEVIDRA
jgi:flagellar biosynthesis/type III secretory pathway M-ring protein FliF/YscJ